MKRKTSRRVFCLALCLLMVLALYPVSAFAVTQDEIDALRAERDAVTAQREEKQAQVDALKEEQAGVLERKAAMDERNEFTRQQIQLINDEIALYDEMIADKEQEYKAAKQLEDEQLERYRVRVRAMEENGTLGLLAMILRTSNLGEMLTIMDDVGEIMESDRELEDKYIEAREHTEEVKAEYEAVKAELEADKAELRTQQAELEKDIEEAAQLIRSIGEDIENHQAEYQELLEAEVKADEALTELIAKRDRERAEEAARIAAENAANGGGGGGGGGTPAGTGSFGWPCPGCSYVTSRAGNRWHPIFNEWRYHSGMDIGAGYGSAVVASDSGTVILAGVNGGYGDCVMIDHNNGYVTLYGHLSGYAVSEGQWVDKGSTIGYVGSSGWATGPHLHFEIRLNGGAVDPEATAGFGGLTYAPDAGE